MPALPAAIGQTLISWTRGPHFVARVGYAACRRTRLVGTSGRPDRSVQSDKPVTLPAGSASHRRSARPSAGKAARRTAWCAASRARLVRPAATMTHVETVSGSTWRLAGLSPRDRYVRRRAVRGPFLRVDSPPGADPAAACSMSRHSGLSVKFLPRARASGGGLTTRGHAQTARPFGSGKWKPGAEPALPPWTGQPTSVDNQGANVDEHGSCVETAKPPHLALASEHGPQHLVFRA